MKAKLIKLFVAGICALLILTPKPSSATSKDQSIKEITEHQLSQYDVSALEQLWELLHKEGINLNSKSLSETIIALSTGEVIMNEEQVVNYVLDKMVSGIKNSLSDITFLLIVILLCGVIKNMLTDSFGNVKDLYEYVAFIIVAATLLRTFNDYVSLTVKLLNLIQSFTKAIFPPLITLMTAVGGISSASVFQPAMLFIGGGMIELMSNVIMPIGLLSGTTGIASGISKKIDLGSISSFFTSLSKWILGIISTVFVGILSLQGMMASTFDGISIKTAKYTVDTVVPIVGGLMSDTADTVLGCSLLLKNAIGISGLFLISGLCIIPLIKYINGIIAYKLVSGVLSAFADSKISNGVKGLVNAITSMFAIVCVVLAMTFITITLAINACNSNVMLR